MAVGASITVLPVLALWPSPRLRASAGVMALSGSSSVMNELRRVVRVGRPQDQDRWRRDDYAALSPDRRLRLMLELREAAWPDAGPLRRCARVRRLGR